MKLEQVFVKSLTWRGLYFFSLLLVNIVLSRVLSAEGNGRIYYLSNIFSFIQLISSLCLETGIGYYAANKQIAHNKLFSIAIVTSLIVSLLLFIIGECYIKFSNHSLIDANGLWYALYYITGISIVNNLTRIFYAEDDFFSPNVWLACINIVFVIICVVAVFFLKANQPLIVHLYFTSFLASGIALIVLFFLKYGATNLFMLPSFNDVKKVFRYSILALFANVIFFLVYRIDYFFVHNSPVCSANDLGNYIQASKMGQLMLVIPQILSSVVFPRTAAGEENKEMHNALFILSRLLMRVYILVILIVMLCGNYLFTHIFGDSFNKMKLPFIILLPGLFSVSLLTILASYFAGKGLVKVNVIAASIALTFVSAGDYLLVPKYGIVAAAFISSVGYTINVAIPLFIFKRKYQINLFEFVKWQRSDYIWLLSFFKKQKEVVI